MVGGAIHGVVSASTRVVVVLCVNVVRRLRSTVVVLIEAKKDWWNKVRARYLHSRRIHTHRDTKHRGTLGYSCADIMIEIMRFLPHDPCLNDAL